MGSGGKKKTTMAKLARESRLRERRLNKQLKRDARKQTPSDDVGTAEGSLAPAMSQSATSDPGSAGIQPATRRIAAEERDAVRDEAASGVARDMPNDDPAPALDPDNEVVRTFGRTDAEPSDPREKEAALLRLRDASDEELAVFEAALRKDALEAGANERELRDAQRNHPSHGA